MSTVGLVRREAAPLMVLIAFVERWEEYQFTPENKFDARACCHEDKHGADTPYHLFDSPLFLLNPPNCPRQASSMLPRSET